MTKCFACNRKLGINPPVADTRDDQRVFVGSDCYLKIKKAGETGYQPPLGGPKLWTLPKRLTQQQLADLRPKN